VPVAGGAPQGGAAAVALVHLGVGVEESGDLAERKRQRGRRRNTPAGRREYIKVQSLWNLLGIVSPLLDPLEGSMGLVRS
jgi:hypothetical protein